MEIGTGMLGWTPKAFWRSTLPELLAAYRGYQAREDRRDLRTGMVVAAIYEQQRDTEKRRDPITAYDFFPHLRPTQEVIETIEDADDEPHEDDDGLDDYLRALKGSNGARTADPTR